MLSACNLLKGEEDKCKDTAKTEIPIWIVPNLTIMTDGVGEPIPVVAAKVKFNCYKQYCDGEIPSNGIFNVEGTTDNNGAVNFGMMYSFKYANTEDFVYYTYTITKNNKDYEVKGSITYNEVYNWCEIASFNCNYEIGNLEFSKWYVLIN